MAVRRHEHTPVISGSPGLGPSQHRKQSLNGLSASFGGGAGGSLASANRSSCGICVETFAGEASAAEEAPASADLWSLSGGILDANCEKTIRILLILENRSLPHTPEPPFCRFTHCVSSCFAALSF